MEREQRIVDAGPLTIERRAEGDGGGVTIRGHAAVFNQLSENLGGFREQIAPGAFDTVLNDDVRALFNHDSNLILGRSKSKTLRLSVDDEGLVYEVDLPDTQASRDLVVSMERNDVTQSSFAFSVEDQSWGELADGTILRTIEKISRLFDVSPVTYPAYPDAAVGLRSIEAGKRGLEEYQQELKAQAVDGLAPYKRHLRLIEIG